MRSRAESHKKRRDLKWYELLIAATLVYVVGLLLGGSNTGAGSVVLVGAYILFLITLANAARQGIKAEVGTKPSISNRIGAFLLALIITFIVLGVGAQVNPTSEPNDLAPSSSFYD